MILKIELENFFSIKDRIRIDFRAANINTVLAKELSYNVMEWKGVPVLKSIGLFGPNASGKRRTNFATSIFRRGCANLPTPSTAIHTCKYRQGGWQSTNTERTKRKHGRHKWQTMILISSKAKMCCSLTTSSPEAYPTPPQPRTWKRVGQTCWEVCSWQRHFIK